MRSFPDHECSPRCLNPDRKKYVLRFCKKFFSNNGMDNMNITSMNFHRFLMNRAKTPTIQAIHDWLLLIGM